MAFLDAAEAGELVGSIAEGDVAGEVSGITTWDVSSECIASLSYNRQLGVAIFSFVKGGKEYTAPMSIQQATAWAHAPSVGEYFNEKIKGVYGR